MPDCAGCGTNNDNGDCYFSKAREAYIIKNKRIPQGTHLGGISYASYCNFHPNGENMENYDMHSLEFEWIAVKKNNTDRYMFFPLSQIKQFVIFPEEDSPQQRPFAIFGKQ